MARAATSTVRRLVYENLGVSSSISTYGTLLASNERYPSAYIDDKIAEADIATIMILFKNKQSSLLTDIYQTQATVASGAVLSQNWIIVNISIGTVPEVGMEIPFGMYEQLAQAGIYDITTYKGYFAKKNSRIYYIGDASTATITYIDMTHPTTLTVLQSPSGFEGAVANLASANLLMKRGDKPDQATYYMNLYKEFMTQFMSPDSNEQDVVSD